MQRKTLGLFFVVLSFGLFVKSTWILAKAELAQLLLAPIQARLG